jgi:hypothetical protein
MAIDIEYSTYMEIVADIISLIQMKEFEGLDTQKQWGLLKCLRGIMKKQCGIVWNVKKDSLGDYYVERKA